MADNAQNQLLKPRLQTLVCVVRDGEYSEIEYGGLPAGYDAFIRRINWHLLPWVHRAPLLKVGWLRKPLYSRGRGVPLAYNAAGARKLHPGKQFRLR